ncbi:iron chaperone [Mycetocola zhadangensis]|uniref:iron chaperone n=1 Tax=Mycetocola zhadangensis TaxID=1164595 RepID=UPI003A4D1F60
MGTTDSRLSDAQDGFSAEEREAMKERARELKAEARRGERDAKAREKGEADLLEKIAEMSSADRAIAERLHTLITSTAPELFPKTWYGMPAYAKNGEVLCFIQPADKFGTRYSTLGFNDPAKLDDGTMWPTAYALTELTEKDEQNIAALITKAVG